MDTLRLKPRRPTMYDAAANTAGPARNRRAIPKRASFVPHTMILSPNPMNNPANYKNKVMPKYLHKLQMSEHEASNLEDGNSPRLNMAIPRPASERMCTDL